MSLDFIEKKASNIISYIVNKSSNKKINNLCLLDNETGASEVQINNDHKFTLAPKPINEKERSVLFIAGESGAGKSYFAREYAKDYNNKLFPHNQIYIINYLDKDETLDSYKNTFTFKDLGISYEDVILKFMSLGLLPRNFFTIKSNDFLPINSFFV